MAAGSSPCTTATSPLPPAPNGLSAGSGAAAGIASGENNICRSIWRHAGTVMPSAASPARVSAVRRVSFKGPPRAPCACFPLALSPVVHRDGLGVRGAHDAPVAVGLAADDHDVD